MNRRFLLLGIAGTALASPLAAATNAVPPPAAAIDDPASLQTWQTQIEAELRSDILPFWLEHTRDREHGGFYGEIRNDLTVHNSVPRGALLTSRILWTFSAAYRRYHDPAYLEMARWAYQDLLQRFWDSQHGGLYWAVKPDGSPSEPRKVVYGQAFGIYALAEYHRASGEAEPLERAKALYHLVETHAHDQKHGGYFEEFTVDWKRLPNSRRSFVSPAAKSQNTMLHVMEAYANLLRVWPDPGLRANQRDLVEVMLTRVLNPATHHLRLFMDEDWTPKSDRISFGHDIEFSWLLVETCEVLGDPALVTRAKSIAVEIARATLPGLDADGGMLSEAGPSGLLNTNKEWWEQAESLAGFLNAYQISGEPQFLLAARNSWAFINAHVIDHQHGEWFNMLARNGTVILPVKVSLWKCPYHNGRACLEMVERLGELLRDSGKQ